MRLIGTTTGTPDAPILGVMNGLIRVLSTEATMSAGMARVAVCVFIVERTETHRLIFRMPESRRGSGEPAPKERAANAAFIVRACNAHYELVEALEAVKAWMDDLDIPELQDGKLTNLVYTALERAKGETEVVK